MAALSGTLLELHDVTVAYDRHPAVHHLTGSFRSGSLTGVVGPNGAGKSTLMKALTGQLALSTGRIARHGLKPTDLAYLPQAADIERRFPMVVADMVLLGAWRSIGFFRGLSQADAERAKRALSAVDLEGFERRPVGELSAGQFQRVLFARLLLQDARLVLLDEPFTAIDAKTTADLLAIVRRWHGEGRTVIAVLHDIEQVREHFPDTLLLAREAIAWGPTHEAMSPANLQRARTMAERWDEDAGRCATAGGAERAA